MNKYISDLLELIKAHRSCLSSRWWTARLYAMTGTLAGWGPGVRTVSQSTWFPKEHIFFFDDEDVEFVLIEVKGNDEFLSMTDKEAREAYNALPWVECIAVDINTP